MTKSCCMVEITGKAPLFSSGLALHGRILVAAADPNDATMPSTPLCDGAARTCPTAYHTAARMATWLIIEIDRHGTWRPQLTTPLRVNMQHEYGRSKQQPNNGIALRARQPAAASTPHSLLRALISKHIV